MVPGEALDEPTTAWSMRVDLAMLKRGLRLRLIVTEVCLPAEHWSDYLNVVTAEGAEVRVHPAPPMLLVLLDDISVIPAPDENPGALILRGPALTQPTRTLCEEVWSVSSPLAEVTPSDILGADLLSETRARQVLTLLAPGLTDEANARRLGVSVRTVRRRFRPGRRCWGATSRFQAGVLAVQRGWIGSPPSPPASPVD